MWKLVLKKELIELREKLTTELKYEIIKVKSDYVWQLWEFVKLCSH